MVSHGDAAFLPAKQMRTIIVGLNTMNTQERGKEPRDVAASDSCKQVHLNNYISNSFKI